MSAAGRHLAVLAAEPRPAGGAAEARARAHCAAVLAAAGFATREEPFEYSAIPGRWGTPLAGVAAALLFLAAGHLGAHGQGGSALVLLSAGALLLAALAGWLARRGVLALPFARARSTTLIATRGAPELWLMAHLDSKSQPVPIGVRAVAILASIALWLAAIVLAAAQQLLAVPPALWIAITVLGVLAALPVIASVVGARSPGALDDASGVATVLRAAELLPAGTPLGVVLTSAEELGLAGARAWARGMAPGRAVNVDGVDDDGGVHLSWTRRKPAALLALLGAGAWPPARRLLPGVLVDGVALADAGWSVVTVSKGSWRTVGRIHTPRDDLTRLDGRGVEEVAQLLARAIARG
jgi:hypothetical protein